jgi:hypothetical protein
MRRFALVCCAAVLAGCAESGDQPATEMDTTAMGAMSATISLADVAGTWNVRVMPENSDSTLTTYQLMATATTDGWMNHFPNREPIPVRVVAVEGDSIVTESGPYESVLRPGVMVWVRTVTRLQNGMLVGTAVAHYTTTAADSVVTVRTEGTRAQ